MTQQPETARTIAIVGRPNVGKSAIFNRLLRKRLAIVHEETGVTRDRLACEAEWNGERFTLIDTGGLSLMDGRKPDHVIVASTCDQAELAIQEAAVILFVVNTQEGVVPLDEEVARILHRRGCPVFVAANKADTPARDADALDFERLGFPVHPVSALHNRGIGDLMAAACARLPDAPPAESVPALKVAVVGRPNSGKSSYINRLLGSDRVIVSETPGTTRDSIEIPFRLGRPPHERHYTLIDTAGMRRHGRIHDAVEHFSMLRAEQSIAEADVVVLLLDATQGPTVQDKKIADTIVARRKGCVMFVNKWDLAEAVRKDEYERALRREMTFFDYAPVLFISAQTGYNMAHSIEAIDHVSAQVRTTLSTGILNRVLRETFERRQPPMVKGARLKLYYATQVGVQPIRIRLFVNDPLRRSPAYEAHLVHTLRRRFGLEGAPVVVSYRSSHESADSEKPARRSRRRPG